MKPTRTPLLALAVALASAAAVTTAEAAVLEISAIGTSTSGNDVTLTSLTSGVNADGTETLIGSTATAIGASSDYYWGDTEPASKEAATSGLSVSSGSTNVEPGADFQIGPLTTDSVLFIFDYWFSFTANNDTITLGLIDNTGTQIGDYSLALDFSVTNGTDLLPSNPIQTRKSTGAGFGTQELVGLTFLVSDFTGTTGDLSTATGVTVLSNGGSDLAAVGALVVPEPGSLALMGLGAALVASRRRRD